MGGMNAVAQASTSLCTEKTARPVDVKINTPALDGNLYPSAEVKIDAATAKKESIRAGYVTTRELYTAKGELDPNRNVTFVHVSPDGKVTPATTLEAKYFKGKLPTVITDGNLCKPHALNAREASTYSIYLRKVSEAYDAMPLDVMAKDEALKMLKDAMKGQADTFKPQSDVKPHEGKPVTVIFSDL